MGGGYEDKCNVEWNSVNNTWKQINGKYYMFQQVQQARFDLASNYQNLVKFEAGQDFTFECFFLIDDQTNPREIRIDPTFIIFGYQSFDSDGWRWGETNMNLCDGAFIEDGTTSYYSLPYTWGTSHVISENDVSKIYKRGCINHWACARNNGVISVYGNGIKISTLNYNRKLYNSTGGAGIHFWHDAGNYHVQNPIIGLNQYHISNVARYTDGFTYIPKIIYQYDDNILKVY